MRAGRRHRRTWAARGRGERAGSGGEPGPEGAGGRDVSLPGRRGSTELGKCLPGLRESRSLPHLKSSTAPRPARVPQRLGAESPSVSEFNPNRADGDGSSTCSTGCRQETRQVGRARRPPRPASRRQQPRTRPCSPGLLCGLLRQRHRAHAWGSEADAEEGPGGGNSREGARRCRTAEHVLAWGGAWLEEAGTWCVCSVHTGVWGVCKCSCTCVWVDVCISAGVYVCAGVYMRVCRCACPT